MQPDEQAYHYGVIRRAIEVIDAGGADLSLEELSAQMGMSPAHFQRIFSAWAGVSPKRYQQYLRLTHAKSLLREELPLLETAHAVGLSGSGRLHDLFLRWEAMSPGDYARRGEGLVVRWGWFDSPFGLALAMGTDKGLCGLAFAAEVGAEPAMADMRTRWPKAQFVEDPMALRPQVEAAFARRGETALHLIGAPLQIKVWEALLTIPEGSAATYGEIAEAIDSPRAVRAVGTAVGKNPLSWLIPCHRVLRKGGAMGGYHWGLPVKRAMLAFEAARTEADAA
ncbi:methylated-DNA--[protein]-cysteine S-methyltransferase [Arenibacterium sp. LLYu02]|uniref:methylated-DNA--[protein]-cysteine S-methyltransferase n=1 Tax=Arenibacterium sp. LLYu02 TaxID=3404132 RepID=UPI003B21AE9B